MKTRRLGGPFSFPSARTGPYQAWSASQSAWPRGNCQVRFRTPVPLRFWLILPMITGMPNLYFCQPHAQNQGMLRAVLTLDDCKYLVAPNSAVYVGDKFPAIANKRDSAADFAVLRVSAEEADGNWRSG